MDRCSKTGSAQNGILATVHETKDRLYALALPPTNHDVVEFPDARAATQALRKWIGRGRRAARFRSALARAGIAVGGGENVVDQLGQAVHRGRLLVIVMPHQRVSVSTARRPAEYYAPPTRRPDPVKTWIEIELLRADGTAAGGEDYWIRFPGGREQEGQLDQNGRAYFGGLEPGTCEVRFPQADADECTVRVPTRSGATDANVRIPGLSPRPADTDGRKREDVSDQHYIEFELTDEADFAMAGVAYSLVMPDGSTHTGSTDDAGRGRVEGFSAAGGSKAVLTFAHPPLELPTAESEGPASVNDQEQIVVEDGRPHELAIDALHHLRLNRYRLTVTYVLGSAAQGAVDYPIYELESDDGAYYERLGPQDDLVPGDNFLQLRFDNLIPGPRYTMRRWLDNDVSEPVFDGLDVDVIKDQPRDLTNGGFHEDVEVLEIADEMPELTPPAQPGDDDDDLLLDLETHRPPAEVDFDVMAAPE